MFDRTSRTVVAVAALLLLPATAAIAQDSPAPIGGEASTEDRQNAEERAPLVVVSDVRVGSHEGFDRVVFEIGGDGQAGWFIEYDDDPVSDGSGEPVEVAGGAALRVSLTNIATPEDAPEGVDRWEGDVAGPAGGVVTEVVDDVVFEGMHTFFVGVDEERPFRVARLSDPQRVVIDIVSEPGEDQPATDDGDADADETDDDGLAEEDTPVGGVATGLGGGAAPAPLALLATVLGLAVLAVGGLRLAWRRR